MPLAIDKGVLTDLAKLDKPAAKGVSEVFDEFDATTHTGLHLEEIAQAHCTRLRSIRIDQVWRRIVATQGHSHSKPKVGPSLLGGGKRVPFELPSRQQAHIRRLPIEKSPERPHRRRFRVLRLSAARVALAYVGRSH